MNQNVIVDIIERLTALESQVTNLLLDATVTAVHESDNLIDVEVNGVPLPKIPYLTQWAGSSKTYRMPSIGESGTLLVPSGDVENAKFLPGQTTKNNAAPEKDKNKIVREWSGGQKETVDTFLKKYTLENGALKIEMDAVTNFITITAPFVNVKGVLQVFGTPLLVP